MKRINRREFGKLAGVAAALAPFADAWAWPGRTMPRSPQGKPAEPTPPKRLALSKEQEAKVQEAIDRRDRRLAALRNCVLPFDLEPAFVFRVCPWPRPARNGT